jgi:hypothetical protein
MMDTSWAQIAFINGDNYAIHGNRQYSGGRKPFTLPYVDCPVVDTTDISEAKKQEIFSKYIFPDGVVFVDTLIKELVAIGAKVV